jgi:hypothetical protein
MYPPAQLLYANKIIEESREERRKRHSLTMERDEKE